MEGDDPYTEIKAWTMDEQLFKVKLPAKDNVDWAMELSYPFNHPAPMNIVVLNPKRKDFIVLQIAIKMSQQHEDGMHKKGPAAFAVFYHRWKVFLLEKDVSYNINQQDNSWIISDLIYYDGLTKHEFFKCIRHLFNAAMYGNILLDEVMQAQFVQGKKGGRGPDALGDTGGNLYS